jgi:protein-tyrosine phosphatase
MQHLYDLGIRTVISFQNPSETGDEGKVREVQAAVALEKSAAEKVGITYVPYPMNNGGPDSLATMSDRQVMQWCDAVTTEIFKDANQGGVIFHCSAGHDRTGVVAAYIRIKYEDWPVEQAIAEMRRLGHNWVRYSNNGGISSWHEQHLRAIAAMLDQNPPQH